MNRKKGLQQLYVALLLIAIAAGALYIFLSSKPGVEVSCSDKSIGEFKRYNPLMAVTQVEGCKVDLQIRREGKEVCYVENFKVPLGNNVVPCNGLEKFKGEEVYVYVKFFEKGEMVGEDRKTKTYR